MKKFVLALMCVGFASGAAFAGECCGKKKDGDKSKEPTKDSVQQ